MALYEFVFKTKIDFIKFIFNDIFFIKIFYIFFIFLFNKIRRSCRESLKMMPEIYWYVDFHFVKETIDVFQLLLVQVF